MGILFPRTSLAIYATFSKKYLKEFFGVRASIRST